MEFSNRSDLNPDRRLVPAGYFPQWPSYYPEVNLVDNDNFQLIHNLLFFTATASRCHQQSKLEFIPAKKVHGTGHARPGSSFSQR